MSFLIPFFPSLRIADYRPEVFRLPFASRFTTTFFFFEVAFFSLFRPPVCGKERLDESDDALFFFPFFPGSGVPYPHFLQGTRRLFSAPSLRPRFLSSRRLFFFSQGEKAASFPFLLLAPLSSRPFLRLFLILTVVRCGFFWQISRRRLVLPLVGA